MEAAKKIVDWMREGERLKKRCDVKEEEEKKEALNEAEVDGKGEECEDGDSDDQVLDEEEDYIDDEEEDDQFVFRELGKEDYLGFEGVVIRDTKK